MIDDKNKFFYSFENGGAFGVFLSNSMGDKERDRFSDCYYRELYKTLTIFFLISNTNRGVIYLEFYIPIYIFL